MERYPSAAPRGGGTKRTLRGMATMLALSVAITIAGAMPAFAGLATGNFSTFTCGSYGYRNRASVQTASYGAIAGTTIGSYASVSRPTGWYGVKARLYNSSDVIRAQTDTVYSGSACWGMSVWTSAYAVRGNYYSYGISQSWTGSGYHSHATYKSPLQTY